jgi:hypothetical protein
MNTHKFIHAMAALALLAIPSAQGALYPEHGRAIAKEAYIYGYPLVDNYRVLYSYAVDKSDPEYKGPFNKLYNTARVYTPEDKAIQTPNSDTPYSFLVYDLRAEPLVITLPPIGKDRYYSAQFIDLYTFNFDYLGTRTTGNGGGTYMLAGPGWKGAAPKGVSMVFRSETEIGLALYRTQLMDAADMKNVKAIQAGYKVQPLSAFLGTSAPPPAPRIDFFPPIPRAEQRTSPEFFNELAFTLQFCPVHPSEKELRARLSQIGIVPGKKIDFAKMDEVTRRAYVEGMKDGQQAINAHIATITSSADGFGTRKFLKNDYVVRAAAAQLGIYGNSKEEAFYVPIDKDAEGKPLDGSKQYTLRFAPGQFPPVRAFWSLTMYELPDRLLVANPLKRYLINSPMLPGLKKDADGGLTLHIQHDPPGADEESNWLPAPAAKPWMVMRLYLPEPAVLDGKWQAPKLQEVKK